MRIVLLGDVGVLDDMIHIGDEAMFEAFVGQLRRRGVTDIVSISSNPSETTERYGIEAIPSIGFAPASFAVPADRLRAAQEDRMTRVIAAAAGDTAALPIQDPAWRAIESVATADGVAVSGGGNMASIWPLHIFERATLAALARTFGKPFVVSGQTIGPELRGDDRDLVAELLGSARLVSLRETASFALVGELGLGAPRSEGPTPSVRATVDDATFLGADSAEPEEAPAAARPYCAVTLAAHVGDADPSAFATGMARLLDEVSATTGLEIVFFAHFSALHGDAELGDSLAHRRVIDRMTEPSRIEPTTTSVAAASFARGAALSISSRYHPAVFAVSGGVPTVGIAVDDYTTVKLTGALGNFGQAGVVHADDVIDGAAIRRTLDVWESRSAIRDTWSARVGQARADSDAWWDDVVGALGSGRRLAESSADDV